MFDFLRSDRDFSGTSGYALRPDIKASVHAEGLVLLDAARGTVLSSNRVGARIWQGIEAGSSLDRIAAEIATDFGVAPDVVRRDAARFVDELRAEGILVEGRGRVASLQ
jgi:Coenzyme PQQ synthesis protein D (PqqD)